MASTSVTSELRSQWTNPGDVMSLLMLVGGDIVQKALAQLVGVRLPRLLGGIYTTPVAFSFGWVAYAFSSLSTIFSDRRLMPGPDTDIQVINLSNGYVRENNSWVLGRLLRDYEGRVAKADRSSNPPMAPSDSTGKVSLKIDIFVAGAANDNGPEIGKWWFVYWLVILVQQVIAAIPWILHGDWGIFLVTASGTLFALITGSLPQWAAEKWPAPKLWKEKTVALTRGNGHQYVMVIKGHEGAWDPEAMASARLNRRPETPWVLLTLAVLWSLLLITVSGLGSHTWYLVGVGGIGMLQNVWVSAVQISPEAANLALAAYEPRSTITGEKVMEDGVRDVMDALMELERWISKAGVALLPVFFPGSVDYEEGLLNSNREKKFWKRATAQSMDRRQAFVLDCDRSSLSENDAQCINLPQWDQQSSRILHVFLTDEGNQHLPLATS
ncbi:hypothetical protein BO94DRAFT_564269 [Aspergillus sclerotioniger CBS 115572]|uniref:Uncharacterized protein n=1 Tax=Aspergillus sclerotioniger CBS 115572 TaxID=1450535 RepID=A0A317X3J7_9EURO|nr:hypothetical protein BO94DRAFT_564269 [Aspergillus sclerotioniger CBS 115572]PWY93143.1 hypothetical protein BO94DRAFT_564269 [Aspergillus sclerotioniger CBS 115572]